MRLDHFALVEQRKPSRCFQNALNDEHNVRAAGIVFVETERDIVLQRPRQNAFAKFGDLLTVFDDDGVFADQIDPADVAVEVDADARPVEPRSDLLDVRGLAGTMVAGDDDATVFGEACEYAGTSRSLSIPKTCRTDTFMSGVPATSCTAAVIDPPWLRNTEAPLRSDSYGPADGGRNLAEPITAKNPMWPMAPSIISMR